MFRNVVIASHVFAYGTSQALKEYFERKNIPVLFIGHPLAGNVLTWGLGALDTLWQVIKAGKKFDLYVGSNNLNALMGILCKKIGRVKQVVYFSPDYSHNRFNNNFLNFLYHWMDYFCLRNADLVWNSSTVMEVDPMMKEREKRGIPQKYRAKQIQVPDGTDPKEILPFEKIDRHLIGFVGHLREGMGLEILVEVFSEIKKSVSNAKLLVIGSGPIEQKLRKMVEGIEDIELTGYMGDINEVYRRLSYCAFAVAPYEKNTLSEYTDPGKVKVYLSVGLPIVISRVPAVAQEIAEENCGIAVQPGNKEEIREALLNLLNEDHLLKFFRTNAVKLKKKYSWDNNFDRALAFLKGNQLNP
ncbi:MAG: glycosyltransferase [Nitrospinales bacterium]